MNRTDMSYDKEYDERYQIDKNDDEILTNYIEILKLVNWVNRKILTILRKNLMKEIGWI